MDRIHFLLLQLEDRD